jgi:hypothetical protein
MAAAQTTARPTRLAVWRIDATAELAAIYPQTRVEARAWTTSAW